MRIEKLFGLRISAPALLCALVLLDSACSNANGEGSAQGGKSSFGGATSAGGGGTGTLLGGAAGASAGGTTSGPRGGTAGENTSAGTTSGFGGNTSAGSSSGGVTGKGGTTAASGAGSSTGGRTSEGGNANAGAMSTSPCDAAATVARMKIGWNLGNSLDSVDASKSDTEVETAWGNPKVTPALMELIRTSGFGAIRIPVTWTNRFGAAPDYTIKPAFMQRVEEVVRYALDQNLYVIINVHHDGAEGVAGQWISLVDASKQVTTANTNAVLAQFKKIWVQIAERFKSHGDHLIFESMNEIKVGYGMPIQAYYDQVNGLNQAFVDTVRASAGYNAQRCLVVPGYNTNIEYTLAGFVKPTDTSAGKLILSDHYYDPWSFAGEGSTHTWGTGNPNIDDWAQEDWVRSQVAKLKSAFIDKGLPMIWGEYGAVNQTGYEKYRRYYMEYVTKAVHDAGIAPFVWDNGSTGSGMEAMGLINRNNNSVQYPELLQAILRAVNSNYTLADVAKP